MKKYLTVLQKTKLFYGLNLNDIETMLDYLEAKVKKYNKEEYVFEADEHINSLMILVEGNLHIQNIDYWGNKTIINYIGIGEMFGESYALSNSITLHNDIVALEDSVVMFFNIYKLIQNRSPMSKLHMKIIENFIYAISEKNRILVVKLGFLSKRSIRDKLIAYLSDQAIKKNSAFFEIPFSRQELADYLSVDRSALSKELCKMRDEGILKFNKNKFTLLTNKI